MLNKKELGQAIASAIELKKAAGKVASRAEIARYFDVKPPSITDWVNKGTISKEKLPALFRFFSDVVGPEHWGLLPSELSSFVPTSPDVVEEDIKGSIPLVSWVKAGEFSEAVDPHEPGHADEWIATTATVKRHTFALRVFNDSMEPDFPPGTILIVEPEIDPLPGDFVIVKNGDNEATFKQLIKDGADLYLKPLNPRYPIKRLDEDCRIVGVVRSIERRFR